MVAANVVPPLVMLALILGRLADCCARKAGATLPSPSKIWSEAHDLIVDPFFDRRPQDIGLGWRVSDLAAARRDRLRLRQRRSASLLGT